MTSMEKIYEEVKMEKEKMKTKMNHWLTSVVLGKLSSEFMTTGHVFHMDLMDAVAKTCERDSAKRESCAQTLKRLMDERGMSASQLSDATRGKDPSSGEYKDPEVTYNAIWKILHCEGRQPTTQTLEYLAVAMRLTPKEMDELLRSAGRCPMPTDPFDVATSICISYGIYDREEVDKAINICSTIMRETD